MIPGRYDLSTIVKSWQGIAPQHANSQFAGIKYTVKNERFKIKKQPKLSSVATGLDPPIKFAKSPIPQPPRLERPIRSF